MLDDETKSLSGAFKTILRQLQTQLKVLDSCIDAYGKLIVETVKNNDIMVSSAYFNEVGNGANYRRGRDVSASLGIVPRQHSSGGKDTLLGISKRGNGYLRCLLIQGAKAVVSRANTKNDKLSQWINRLVQTRGHNRACVAYANKMARMAWAISVSGEEYSPV